MKYQYGKYSFHRPLKRERCVVNPFTEESLGWKVSEAPVIEGYIDHSRTNWGYFSLFTLLLIYNRPALKKWLNKQYQELGRGWRCQWWRPSSYLNNIAHFIRYGKDAIPIKYFRVPTLFRPVIRIKQLAQYREHFPYVQQEQLPF